MTYHCSIGLHAFEGEPHTASDGVEDVCAECCAREGPCRDEGGRT